MKHLIFILISLNLIACSSDGENELINLTGIYGQGTGTVDGAEIFSFEVLDKGQSIDVSFSTSEGLLDCKYVFLEKLDENLYFVTIPEGDLNILNFELINKEVEVQTLGQLNEAETDPCNKVSIQTRFKKLSADEVLTLLN